MFKQRSGVNYALLIKELLDEGFETINISQYKLSAFMPVCKAMLDLVQFG